MVITRRIINPVELVVGAMKRILHGDLSGEEMAIASRTPEARRAHQQGHQKKNDSERPDRDSQRRHEAG